MTIIRLDEKRAKKRRRSETKQLVAANERFIDLISELIEEGFEYSAILAGSACATATIEAIAERSTKKDLQEMVLKVYESHLATERKANLVDFSH